MSGAGGLSKDYREGVLFLTYATLVSKTTKVRPCSLLPLLSQRSPRLFSALESKL
jgi:hypothetical protein